MVNNPKLDLLMEKIFDDEEIVNQIMATDDMLELYEICQKVQDGYTFAEFCEFFDSLVCMCLDGAAEAVEGGPDSIGQLSESDLKQITGGANDKLMRMGASVLASLNFFTAAHGYAKDLYEPDLNASIHHESDLNASIHQNDAGVILRPADKDGSKGKKSGNEFDDLRPLSEEKSEGKQSFKTKAGNFFSKAADFVWDNKGKIMLGAIALAAGGALLVHDHKQIGENIETAIKRKEKIKELEDRQRSRYKDGSGDDIKVKDEDTIRAEIEKRYVGPDGKVADADKEKVDKEVAQAIENQTKIIQAKRDAQSFDSERIKQLKDDKLSDILKNKLPFVGGVAAVGGGVGKVLSTVVGAIGKVKQTGGDIMNIVDSSKSIKQKVDALQKQIERQEQAKRPYDEDSAKQELIDFFDKDVKGQEKAKEEVMNFFIQYNAERNAAAEGIEGNAALPPAKFVVFNGASGTGKTYTAKKLSDVLSNVDPYITTANNIKQCAKSNYMSIPDAFLYGRRKMDGGAGNKTDQADNLFQYLKDTEGSVRVVILDEWDKLYAKENGEYPQTHQLDETFRDMIDGNLKDWQGNEVDLSGVIFICTTNETKASLQAKIKVSASGKELLEIETDNKGRPTLDEDGDYIYKSRITRDESGTQTIVPHDPSLVARISNICYFDSLKPDDYEAIARRAIEDVRSITTLDKYKEYINSDEHKGKPIETLLKQRFYNKGLDGVIITDEGYKLIAKCAGETTSAARFIVGTGRDTSGSVCGNLSAAISKYCGDVNSKDKSYKGLTLLATPYEDTNSTGSTVIKFKIEPLGYDGYDKYVEQLKSDKKS